MDNAVLVNVELQERNASNQNQSTETVVTVNEQTNRGRGVICLITILIILFFVIALFRLLSFFVFTTYDMQCLIIENASVIDCGQDTFLPKPEVWIFSWMLFSFISSLLFLFIVKVKVYWKPESLNFQSDKAKRCCKKGSSISLILLTILTEIYYGLRIAKAPAGFGKATSVLLFFWPPVMLRVVWRLNYTLQVRWKPVSCCSTSCLPKNILFFFYWIALLMYFLETSVKLLSVLLDVAYDAAPLFERQYGDESLKGFLILLIGFRLAFHTRLAYFFWQKIFHGEKDLFSEPCSKLMDNNTPDTNEPPSTNGNTPLFHPDQRNQLQTHQQKRAGGKQLKRLIRESEQRKRRRNAFK